MKGVTALLTCCGDPVTPGLVQSLRLVKEREIRIIGVDMKESPLSSYLVDRFSTVPSGDAPGYVNALLQIAEREGVEVVLPFSDEESLALSREKRRFEEKGIKIACSNYAALETAYDKGRCYRFLAEKGLPCPQFYIVHSTLEFREATSKLGYPQRVVVMKPPLSRGDRGTRIMSATTNARDSLLREKPGSLYADLEDVLRALGQKDFPELVLMEYLPGEDYSVDLLAREGEALIVVPKVRLERNLSRTLVAEVRLDRRVVETAVGICRAFGFSYNVNLQMKYSEQGQPLPYDINPRVGASVAFCTAAGANLIYYAVKIALGEEVPRVEVEDGVKMFRAFRDLFVSSKGPFYLP